MAACSDPTFEPGPITPLDAHAGLDVPEPPTFTPIAHAFSSSLPGFYSAFDSAIGVLDAEAAIDIGLGIADGLSATPTTFATTVNPEALSNLQAAEDGYRVARDKTASLKSGIPSDVQQPTGFALLMFRVHDATGAPVVGALVQLDADFGNGATRSTDGNGFCSFGVAFNATVAYTITAAGFAPGSGVAARVEQFVTVAVTLQAA